MALANYPKHRLDHVAEIAAGNPAPQDSNDFTQYGLPFIRMQDVGRVHHSNNLLESVDRISPEAVKRYRLRLFPAGSLLIPKSGASVNLNHRAMLGRDAYVVSHLAVLVPDRNILLPEYLYFWSLSYDPRSQAQTTSLPSLPLSLIKAAEIPLPPLQEQQRIVDLLSRAEGIVRLRREAEKKAAELIPALFIDMFGDPAKNPKGWQVSKFGDVGVLDRGKSRHRPRDAAELYGGSYPFIQTGDVANSGGRITKHSVCYSEKGLAQSKLWNAGTLCITIAANIAKTGVLTFDACFPDSVVGFLPGNNVRTNYVQAWLAFLQPTLEANAPQAAQKNINLEILRNLPIILPPLKLQTEFEKQCESVFSIQSQQAMATEKALAAFNALLNQAFS